MKICVYSCNFGNYRREINVINTIKVTEGVDYYFFTDNKELKSTKWKIIHCPMIPSDKTMNSSRWTSKYVKFVLPDALKEYDIIIWCDNKCLKKMNIDIKEIQNYFSNNSYRIVNFKHNRRATLKEELKYTINIRVENCANAEKFLKEIDGIEYKCPLPDTCYIVRKNEEITNQLFERVYNLLKEKGLKRDQNVYNHAIYELNYPIEDIYIKNTCNLY
jgi:hypothetical protein